MHDIFQILLSPTVLFNYAVSSSHHTVSMIDDQMNEQAQNIGVMEMIKKRPNYRYKILPQCHIIHHKSHNGCDKREGLCRKRPASNQICHGKARTIFKINSCCNILYQDFFCKISFF